MDVVLVDRHARLTEPLREALLPGDRLVCASEAQLAGGAWWPAPERTRGIWLAADRFDAPAMRALHRLWIAEHGPASFLLNRRRSEAARLLDALLGPTRQRFADTHWRAVADLTLAHLLALERLASRP